MLMTGHAELSEDIVQEVFVRLWMNREKLSTVENFNGYLYRLQKNPVLDTLRREEKERAVCQKYFFDKDKPVVTVAEIFEKKEWLQKVENLINTLPQQQQRVYRLSREKGLKRGEIASLLKISRFTVKCHLHKALKFLRVAAENEI